MPSGGKRRRCPRTLSFDLNCRIAVSLSLATWDSSLPIAYRLYLPKDWAEDAERREEAEVPEDVEFRSELPYRGKPIAGHVGFQSTDCLSSLSAQGLGRGCRAAGRGGGARGR